MKEFIAFISGLIFAMGLGVSGMTRPQVVRGFLDFFGSWDPRLVGVIGGAIAFHAIAYRLIRRRATPLLDLEFHVPSRKDIDGRLLLGAALFGLGWGWSGICPGPGIVGLASGKTDFFYFIGSMLFGMLSFQFVERKYLKKG